MKTEQELADELGINRKVFKKWRMDGIVSGWEKSANTIIYHPEGEAELREVVQCHLMVEELDDPLPDPHPYDPIELKITEIPKNQQMVICGDVKVRVKDNKNFLTGMKLKARAPAEGHIQWVMIGRCPRYRGRY